MKNELKLGESCLYLPVLKNPSVLANAKEMNMLRQISESRKNMVTSLMVTYYHLFLF